MTSNPFENGFIYRLKRAAKAETIDGAANALYGPTVDKYSEYLDDVKEDLKKADMDILFRTYVSKVLLATTFVLIAGIGIGTIYSFQQNMAFAEGIRYAFGIPMAVTLIVFSSLYFYPSQKARRRQKNINENLPFAMNHLSAIATSGIPPTSMFELLAGFDEYEGISREAEKVTRRVNAFGEDLTTALREVAEQSPSADWDEVIYGILSTVETGGNLESFLKEKAEEALFEYQIEREKEIERLSTYASFYTAILIAAPVFLVTILSVMNLLGGDIAGFAIRDLMWAGVHIIIPLLNIGFLLFLGIKVN